MMYEIMEKKGSQIVGQAEIGQELLNSWLDYIKDSSTKTQETYTRNIRQFLYFLQDNGITHPTRDDIVAYRDSLLKSGKKPTTVNGYLMAVKQFFKWTAYYNFYPNITEQVKSVKLDTGFRKDCLTSKQASRLLNNIDRSTLKGLRDYAILLLMVTTGLRTVEIMRANVEDLRNVADFTALFIQGKGHNEKTAYVKVEEPVEEAIRAYLKARGKAAAEDPLFTSNANRNAGGRMTTRSISRIAKSNMIDADLNSSRLTAHSLRHTAATLNLINGGSVEETQQMLRHSNINTTLIYSHALERAANNSEARVTAAILG